MKVAMVIPDNRDEFRRFEDPEPYFGPAPTALLEGLAGLPQCEVHVVSCTHRPMKAPVKLADNIFFHLIEVPSWGWTRGFFLGCALAVRRKLRELRPDIVHGQGTERYCALAAVMSGLPNVLTLHGNMRSVARRIEARPFSFYWLAARQEALALPRTFGVFCNSGYTEDQVRPLARKVWRVPNAVQQAYFTTPVRSGPSSVPRLLNVGTILPYKRQTEILQAVESLHDRGFRFELLFVGQIDDSPYARSFRTRLSEVGQKGYARHAGSMARDEMIRCLDEGAALVHFPTEEAFGLVVAEALARNLKVFGVRAGGVADIASGAEGAELFEPDDWAGLLRAVESWLTSGCPRPREARRLMFDRYSSAAVAGRHVQIYQEILGA